MKLLKIKRKIYLIILIIYSVDLKNNENEKKENKKNINELSTSNEQFTVKALYPQSSHVTLQSISDNIFMQLAEKYVDSDSLLK